jgi:rod shape-determining protein MreC
LLYLPHGASVTPGDRIVTSAAGGAFPPGLPVGVVQSVDDGIAVVQLFVDWDRMEFLRLIDYRLPGVLPGEGDSLP